MDAADTFRNLTSRDVLNTPSMRSVRGVSSSYLRKPLPVYVITNVLRDRHAASHANVKYMFTRQYQHMHNFNVTG